MVAFGGNGLTRRTDGAKMLGVISRRAVVSGSMPEEAVRAQWDQVSSYRLLSSVTSASACARSSSSSSDVSRSAVFLTRMALCCRWRTAASSR